MSGKSVTFEFNTLALIKTPPDEWNKAEQYCLKSVINKYSKWVLITVFGVDIFEKC